MDEDAAGAVNGVVVHEGTRYEAVAFVSDCPDAGATHVVGALGAGLGVVALAGGLVLGRTGR